MPGGIATLVWMLNAVILSMATPTLFNLPRFALFRRLNSDLRKGGDIPAVLAAGMPDIKGGLNRILCSIEQEGCFYGVNPIKVQMASENTSNQGVFHNIMFDAQRSNPIFGNSYTVQPPALALIPQIKY